MGRARLGSSQIGAPRKALILIAAALCVAFLIRSRTLHGRTMPIASYQSASTSLRAANLNSIKLQGEDYERNKNKTLVVYVYHESSQAYADNLAFFLKVGIGKELHPLVDYLIIVNGEAKIADFSSLPPTVSVIRRDNSCYDGGSIGEVLGERPKLWTYQYYVLMNSSVRGPFLPRYWPASLPWTAAFTQLITERVKLVGTTISCQAQVHVQSMVLATDNVGLRIMYEGGALDCPRSMEEAIHGYEFGSTNTIMKRGFTIDCLMGRYRHVDWRRDPHKRCNNGYNPQLDLRNDGHNLDPFEVLFVKVKDFPLKSDTPLLRRVSDYYLGRDDVTSSGFDAPRLRAHFASSKAALLDTARKCKATFDAAFYKAHNPDLTEPWSDAEFFEQFIEDGYEERRNYRFEVDLEAVGEEMRDACANLHADVQ